MKKQQTFEIMGRHIETGKITRIVGRPKPPPCKAQDFKVRRIEGPDGNKYTQIHHNLIVNETLGVCIPSTDGCWSTVLAWFPKGRLKAQVTEKHFRDFRDLAVRYQWQIEQAEAKARHFRALFCHDDCQRQWYTDAETTFGVMRRYVESWGFELIRHGSKGLRIVRENLAGQREFLEVTL